MILKNPALSVEKLTIKPSSNHITIHRHLQQLRKAPKLKKLVPKELSGNNLKSQIDF